jgi:hypothetical protein
MRISRIIPMRLTYEKNEYEVYVSVILRNDRKANLIISLNIVENKFRSILKPCDASLPFLVLFFKPLSSCPLGLAPVGANHLRD